MASEAANLPLEVSDEPLVGWRCWYVLPGEGLLRPIFKRGLVWKPRQAHEAVCPEEPHEVPADGCKCGIWAVCHPMLLQEVAWTFAPPRDTPKLPGVVVVGQVALWGKIVEHERGWRASAAYPRHLYALTDDPMIAETLRERYGIPVEWGEEANRLRRLLPPSAEESDEPAEWNEASNLRAVLLAFLDQAAAPRSLVKLVGTALNDWKETAHSPTKRREAARGRRDLHPWDSDVRTRERFNASTAHAEARALEGNARAASRALWVRLAEWQRRRAHALWYPRGAGAIERRDQMLADLARGRSNGPINRGKRYAAQTLIQKRSSLNGAEAELLALVPEIEALAAAAIPTYNEWCTMVHGAIVPETQMEQPSPDIWRSWHRQAMRRQAQLAGQERTLTLERHQLAQDRQTLDAARAEADRHTLDLEVERAALREDIVASVERDRAALLEEIGMLERRRRAVLAMLPGPWPPETLPTRQPVATRYPSHDALKAQLREAGITNAEIARCAGVVPSHVCNLLAGRGMSRKVVETAQRLLRQHGQAAVKGSRR